MTRRRPAPPPEVEALTEADPAESMETAIDAFRELEGAEVYIYRRRQGEPRPAFVTRIAADELDLVDIQRRFGGGRYMLRSKHRGRFGPGATVDIASAEGDPPAVAPPVMAPAAPPVAPSPAPADGSAALLGELIRSQGQQLTALLTAMAQPRESAGLSDIVALLQVLKPSPARDVRELLALTREMGAGSSAPSGERDDFVAKLLGEAAAGLLRQPGPSSGSQARAAAAPPGGGPPPPSSRPQAPTSPAAPTAADDHAKIIAGLRGLLSAASVTDEPDPESYAVALAGILGEAKLAELASEPAGSLARAFAPFAPGIAEGFLRDLESCLRALLEEDDDGKEGSGAGGAGTEGVSP